MKEGRHHTQDFHRCFLKLKRLINEETSPIKASQIRNSLITQPLEGAISLNNIHKTSRKQQTGPVGLVNRPLNKNLSEGTKEHQSSGASSLWMEHVAVARLPALLTRQSLRLLWEENRSSKKVQPAAPRQDNASSRLLLPEESRRLEILTC